MVLSEIFTSFAMLSRIGIACILIYWFIYTAGTTAKSQKVDCRAKPCIKFSKSTKLPLFYIFIFEYFIVAC